MCTPVIRHIFVLQYFAKPAGMENELIHELTRFFISILRFFCIVVVFTCRVLPDVAYYFQSSNNLLHHRNLDCIFSSDRLYEQTAQHVQIRWVPGDRLPGNLFYFPKQRDGGGGRTLDSQPSPAITDTLHMSLVFPKSLRGHVRAAAVFPPPARPLNCSAESPADLSSRRNAEGSFHEQANVNSSRGHQNDLPPTSPGRNPPSPRPISEWGPRKTEVGKTYCIMPYVTSLPKLIGWAE